MGSFHAKCLSAARLDGKTAVITGCNTGIGKETVKDFFKRGAHVVMACRNLEKAQLAADEIISECKGTENVGKINVTHLDLTSLKSVRTCALELLEKEQRIDLLVNNAGIMACPLYRTEDGFEMQFGTNHLGHFLFTLLLLPKITVSAPARIINVSSMAHSGGSMNFEDLNFEKRSYSAVRAYNQSKLANVLFTKELARRLKDAGIEGVNTYALHPGVIKSELSRHLDDTYFKGLRSIFSMFSYPFTKSCEQGAQTTIYCAVDPKAGEETGLYYAECKESSCSNAAKNMNDAKKLWDESLKLVGLGETYNPFIAN